MTIKNIPIGDLSAEKDQNLSDYFIENVYSYECAEDMDNRQCLLVGRTGSGKSAIIERIYKKYSNTATHTCALIKPQKSYLDILVEMDSFKAIEERDNLSPILFKLVWHYVIMIEVLKSKFGPDGPKKSWQPLYGADLKAYKFLNTVKALSADGKTITDYLVSMIQSISLSISTKAITAGISLNTKTAPTAGFESLRNLIDETNNFLSKGFWDVIKGDKVYILFDDLDLNWNPESPAQQQLIRALMEVMSDYNHKERIKPIVALRTNILKELNLPQREKFTPYVLDVEWSSHHLKEMLAKRIEHYHQIKSEEVNGSFFYKSSTSKDLIDEMIELTLWRPRDLIDLCNKCIAEASKEKSKYITANILTNTEHKYSEGRALALADEWSYQYPHLDTLIHLISSQMQKSHTSTSHEMTRGEFKALADQVRDTILLTDDLSKRIIWYVSHHPEGAKNPAEIAKILYELGILVVRTVDGHIVHYGNSTAIPEINAKCKILLHPMLQPFGSNHNDDSWD